MKNALNTVVLLIFLSLLIIGATSSPTYAVWHVFLDDHFDKDQQNPNLLWPWITDMRNGRGWHWNPQPPHLPHRQSEGTWTRYCWGIQDYIFNTRINPQAPVHQSLWCAYTNRNLINEPRWPEDDNYEQDQNAWVWWGPVDLTDAVSAAVSYWVYLHLENYARDSLSVLVTNDTDLITLDDDPRTENVNEFFENVPVGRTYSFSRHEDWFWDVFYADSLILAGDDDPENRVSMLGEEDVWLCFVWQSDRFEITGKGAFIDDVIFSWDDGLFDIRPEETFLGYPVNEDSTDWGDDVPDEGDHIQFRLDYEVIGVGETPEFNIDLYLNDEMIFRETVSHEGSEDTVYTVIADTLWEVTYGEHILRWELDTPVEDNGSVDEGDEENNIAEIEFEVIYNPPPDLELHVPEVDQDTLDGFEDLLINYTIEDTLDDDEFRVFFYWTEDTSDLVDDPDLVWDVLDTYGFVGREFGARLGEGTFVWEADAYNAELDSGMVFWLVTLTVDGYPNNMDLDVSPGTFIYLPEPSKIESNHRAEPLTFGLESAYPNPFNDALNIRYSVAQDSRIDLSVFDMSGRIVSTLVNEKQTAGVHTVNWKPEGSPAGVYLIRLTSGTQANTIKAIYMP